MLILNNVPLDFDITSPADLKRYNKALETLNHNAKVLTELRGTKEQKNDINTYAKTIETECELLCEFIDTLLGSGTCNRFLGEKISVNSLYDFCADLAKAIKVQANETKDKFAPYVPNKKTSKTQNKKA